MFTRADAVVLRERIRLGWSDIDEDGNEVPVPVKRRPKKPRPEAAIPTVDALFARYANQPDDQRDPKVMLEKIRAMVGKPLGKAEVIGALDVSGLAARAGMSVEACMEMPDDRPMPALEHPNRAILSSATRVPLRFVELLCGRIRDTKPTVDVKAWLDGKAWGICLAGEDRGTGKTTAAVAGMVRAKGGLFVTAEEISAPDGRDLADMAEVAPYLILDDMGDEVLHDLGLQRIRTVLGVRHAANRRTVLTANLSLDAWGDRYGTRLVSRLKEGAGFKQYGGADLRGGT